MKGDFSRETFDPAYHFSRVLMQQGRVLLDADFNEHAAILLRYVRVLASDLLGVGAGPAGAMGFDIITDGPQLDSRLASIEPDATRRAALKTAVQNGDAVIGAGRYYVNGILVENERPILYSEQRGYPFNDQTKIDVLRTGTGAFLAYLDVWERHVTYVDYDHIREVALGGPDTCSRAQVVWQLKILLPPGSNAPFDCGAVKAWKSIGDGWLRARARPGKTADELCVISPESVYRGAENQLYRLEIHDGGAAAPAGNATFKWSRDNGSVIFPIQSLAAGVARLEHLGRDLRTSLAPGNWVEVVDDNVVYGERPGPLARVEAVNRDDLTVTLAVPQGDPDLPSLSEENAAKRHAILRRWDHAGDPAAYGAIRIAENDSTEEGIAGGWIDLEDGVQVWFAKDGRYRTGDYWLIPARVATGDVEWPVELDAQGAPKLDDDGNPIPAAVGADGPHHYYAPIAFGPAAQGGTRPRLRDCRCAINTLPCAGYRYAFSGVGIGPNF
jgi:hypothetical protein